MVKKAIIAYRKKCKASGTGLSHSGCGNNHHLQCFCAVI